MTNASQPLERHYWIQLEIHDWNTQPNQNRMDGSMPDTTAEPLLILKDALILRRYTEYWGTPEDRRVNPWDLNEPDPSVVGTIPGPVLECQVGPPGVGEVIVVHFRNQDFRATPSFGQRAHSLHPHGVVFPTIHDGAYPLSPPDDNQPISSGDPEENAWNQVGVTGFKQGDRVPPGGTFTYRWSTFGWPTTAGVWLYHDHSVMDSDNTLRGAIGFIVVHNEKDPEDVSVQDLPPGGFNGDLIVDGTDRVRRYVAPPKKAFYLQLFHELHDDQDPDTAANRRGSFINGRKNLGSTPTMLGGVDTRMRFGVGAMNLLETHTFHIHGHRWVIPGPSGGHVGGEVPPGTGVQVSIMDRAVSQFEDTKLLGPANTFSFTIRQGTFMGPPLGHQKGEWHMHCHVLDHMKSDGMMGSLLIVAEGDPAAGLPVGTIAMDGMVMGSGAIMRGGMSGDGTPP